MRRPLLVAGLVVVGVALMANPLYLPVVVDDPTTGYAHAVQPVPEGASVDGPSPDDGDSDVVDSDELDADARAAFERALAADGGGFTVTDPAERADSLSYPVEPAPGDGLVVVVHEGEAYEFWTRTVEREADAVVVQRIVVQPAAFLVGFLAVFGAVAVGYRDAITGGPGERG